MKSSESLSEVELLKRAKTGDEVAFNLLFTKHQGMVSRWVARKCREMYIDSSEVNDIVQEVWLNASKGLKNFRGDSKFSSWLFTIVRNTVINQAVKNSRSGNIYTISKLQQLDANRQDGEDSQLTIDDLAVEEDTPEDEGIANEYLQKVMQIIENLPPKLKESIILREIEGLSYEEISQRTHTKLGTVKTQLHRARERINEDLEQWNLSGRE